MGESKHDGLAIPGQVVLAHEPSFLLGALTVHPGTRQVEGQTSSETLEPRVMQALVALYRADGIVTRDELIERCWDGRIVTDDAINRVISRIRHVADGIGARSFAVETIARVGYRIVVEQATKGETAAASAARPIDSPVRRNLIIGACAVTAGAAGSYLALRPGRRSEPTPEAISLYHRALALNKGGQAANNRQAMSYLREAVRIAPDYGEAWGALALTYRDAMTIEPPVRLAGFEDRLNEAVRQANRYDPGNGDAAAALLPADPGFGRWLDYERAYRSALRRHPSHPVAYFLLGSVLMDVGRWADAVAVLSAAKVRDTYSPLVPYKLAISLWASGRISAAEDEIDQANRRWPQHGAIWQTKVKLLALTGTPRAALALAIDPATRPADEVEADRRNQLLILTALATRTPGDVDRAVESIVELVRSDPPSSIASAVYCAALGRLELALELLEGAYLGEGAWARLRLSENSLTTHPLFQPHARTLWKEARFLRLINGIGLERYWQVTGTRPPYLRH